MFPAVLKDVTINKVVITSSYLKEIKPQILRLGVPKELIFVPSKKLGSLHLFRSKSIRLEAAKQLYQIMSMMQNHRHWLRLVEVHLVLFVTMISYNGTMI